MSAPAPPLTNVPAPATAFVQVCAAEFSTSIEPPAFAVSVPDTVAASTMRKRPPFSQFIAEVEELSLAELMMLSLPSQNQVAPCAETEKEERVAMLRVRMRRLFVVE